jgi:hypothetical protein
VRWPAPLWYTSDWLHLHRTALITGGAIRHGFPQALLLLLLIGTGDKSAANRGDGSSLRRLVVDNRYAAFEPLIAAEAGAHAMADANRSYAAIGAGPEPTLQ